VTPFLRDRAGSDTDPAELSTTQEFLLRRGNRVVTAMIVIWLANVVLWVSGALGAIVWVFALLQLGLILAFLSTSRSLRRSGPPFDGVRWWDPWSRR
jgi:hypothetical protein